MSPQTLPPVMAQDSTADEASQAEQMWVPELPNIDHLVFEDGTPLENLFAERQLRLFVEPLYSSWEGPQSGKFVAMANVGVFPEAQQTPLVPDALLSTEVEVPGDPHLRLHRSYLVWIYGKPPDVVLELVSDRKGGELDYNLRRYALIGVAYYVVFDPEHFLGEQSIHVFRRVGSTYTPLAEAWFPEIGLGLKVWPGVFEDVEAVWLRWHDPNGNLLLTGEEQGKRAKEAEEQARHAEEQARHAEEMAEQKRRQKERLLAQLRALGVKPDL
jgi:Uma2 family endonuclease